MSSKKTWIFLTINQKVFVTQDKRLEEKGKEKKTFQVRNQFILMMNQQKVVQKQQSNIPFHLGKKNDEKCKIKDMIYPFNRNKKRKKERQEEGECQHCNHWVPHVHLPVPWWFFLQRRIMMMAGGPKHLRMCCSPTRYHRPYQIPVEYQVPNSKLCITRNPVPGTLGPT